MKLMKKRNLLILIVLSVLVAEAAMAFATSIETMGDLQSGETEVYTCEPSWAPPSDEPLPCTNQRAIAWYGCN